MAHRLKDRSAVSDSRGDEAQAVDLQEILKTKGVGDPETASLHSFMASGFRLMVAAITSVDTAPWDAFDLISNK